MDIIFEDTQFMNNMNNFQSNQPKQPILSFPLTQKSLNQNQNQITTNIQKDLQSSSSSCNFERLFSEIIEAQSDIESMDDGVQKFFKNYMENIVNPDEMKNTINIIKQNSVLQSKLIENFKTLLETELQQNKEKVEKDMKITKQIETKTYQVARAKDMFRELNDMLHGDIISHQKEIKRISDKNKNIQSEIKDYEKEIEELSNENKKSYNEELNLLDTVMSFGKKLYNTYVTREEKKKEKNGLEEQIMKLKEEKKEMDKKFNDEFEAIEKEKQIEEKDFQEKKEKIELFLNSFTSTCSEYDSLLTSLKSFYSKRQDKFNSLQKSTKDKKSNPDSSSISLSLSQLKQNITKCDPSLLQEISNIIEIIRNIHPYLSIPAPLNMNNIVDAMESLITQISCIINEETPQEKLNIERQNQMEEIGNKIADIYHNKFTKNVFFNALRINCVEEKKKKDAERKMKELKDKEEKLKQLQLKYINEKNNKDKEKEKEKDSPMSKKSEKSDNTNTNSFISINDDLEFILKEKETPKNIKERNKKTSPASISSEKSINDKSGLSTNNTSNSSNNYNSSNILNINIKDNKKRDDKKKKNSDINIILEKDTSKSKSESKLKTNNKEKETKKERKDSSEPEKRNNKQKSLKKKIKHSQIKKKNKKKKKFEGDSSDGNVSNKDEDSFMNQIFGITSDFTDKSSENKQLKNCETDRKRAKGDMKFGRHNFSYLEESNTKSSVNNDLDLNDLDFLASLGEEVNKTEKSYGYGRKYKK